MSRPEQSETLAKSVTAFLYSCSNRRTRRSLEPLDIATLGGRTVRTRFAVAFGKSRPVAILGAPAIVPVVP